MSKLKWMTLRQPEWKNEEFWTTGRDGKQRRVKKLVCTPGKDFLMNVVRGVVVSREKPKFHGARECARRVRQMERLSKKTMIVGPQSVVKRERL